MLEAHTTSASRIFENTGTTYTTYSYIPTSVTHLDQAISLDIFVKTCMVLGPPVIYFFALGRKYITVLDEKCLTMNILTGNIWADILC